MSLVSSVEVLRRKQILDEKLRYLENDEAHEKFKTNAEIQKTLTSLNKRIAEKAWIRENNQEARLSKLQEILIDLEKIEAEIETRKFLERLAAAKKIIDFLEKNPDKKIEELKATDFPEVSILQSAKEWKNVLGDARIAIKTRDVLADPKFDWKNPKAYLEKAGETGKEILDVSKKNPVLTSICVLGGIYALYQIFAKKGIWSKIKGAITGAGATLLGLSLFGKLNLKKDIRKWFLEGMIDKKDQKKAKGAIEGANKKLDNVLNLDEENLNNYDKHTQKWMATMRGKNKIEEALLYKMMRDYAKSGGLAMNSESVLKDCAKLEKGEEISKLKYSFLIGAENLTIKIKDGVVEIIPAFARSAATAGGYLSYKITVEELKFCKNFSKWIFNRDIENATEFFRQYGKNAIVVTGVLSVGDYFLKARHMPFWLPKNIAKGALWPVYVAEIAGKSASRSAQFFNRPRLLGRWTSTGKILNFIDKTGRIIAKFSPSTLWLSVKKGGGWVTKKVAGETTKKIGESVTKSAAKKTTTKEILKKGDKLSVKAMNTLKAQLVKRCNGTAAKRIAVEIYKKVGIRKLRNQLGKLVAKRTAASGASFVTGVGGFAFSAAMIAWTTVDVGLMGRDFYHGRKLKKTLTERSNLPIKKMEFDQKTETVLASKLPTNASLNEVQLLPEFNKLSRATIYISRENKKKREKWFFENGKIIDIKIETT